MEDARNELGRKPINLPDGYEPPALGIVVPHKAPYSDEFVREWRKYVAWRANIIQRMTSEEIDQVLSYKRA